VSVFVLYPIQTHPLSACATHRSYLGHQTNHIIQFARLKRPKTLAPSREVLSSDLYDYTTVDDEDVIRAFEVEPVPDVAQSHRGSRPDRSSRSSSTQDVRGLSPHSPPQAGGQLQHAVGSSKKGMANPMGLTLITSPAIPIVDLIFIHGLGGSAFNSWSWEHDPRNFWPAWLSKEPHLSAARVHTFGYAAGISGFSNTMTIRDFAKDLLFKMKYNNQNGPPIGNVSHGQSKHSRCALIVPSRSRFYLSRTLWVVL